MMMLVLLLLLLWLVRNEGSGVTMYIRSITKDGNKTGRLIIRIALMGVWVMMTIIHLRGRVMMILFSRRWCFHVGERCRMSWVLIEQLFIGAHALRIGGRVW